MTDYTSDGALLIAIRHAATAAVHDADGAHDVAHLQRVVRNARTLAAVEQQQGRPVDTFVVEAAGWLHDLVQVPKHLAAPGESARRSAEDAAVLLSDLGVDDVRVQHVCSAIETHSFSGGRTPETLEAALVQDADRLDALGAIGLARLWVTGQAMGAGLYEPTDPAAAQRELDDRRWSLDHIVRKLRKLPGLMQTAAGRAAAEERQQVVEVFRLQMLRELGVAGSGDEAASDVELDLQAILAQQGIDGRIIRTTEPTPTVPDAARVLGVAPQQIVKSLLFRDATGVLALAVLDGASRVDAGALAREVGAQAKTMRLAQPPVVLRVTGYAAGGTPPVGHRTPLEVIVDDAVLTHAKVYGGGGRQDVMLEIEPWEIVRASAARVARIRMAEA